MAAIETITPREAEVIALREKGVPNRIIANRLGIKLGTVKIYVGRLIDKGLIQPKVPVLNYWDYTKLDALLASLEKTINMCDYSKLSIEDVTQSLRACKYNDERKLVNESSQ